MLWSAPVLQADADKSEIPAASPQKVKSSLGQDVPPAVPGDVPEFYLPVGRGPAESLKAEGRTLAGEAPQPKTLYRPALVGQARVAFLERKYNISQEEIFTIRIEEMKRKGLVQWEAFATSPVDLDTLSSSPTPGALFDSLDNLSGVDAKYVNDLETDFTDWIYRTQALTVRVNEALGVVAGPDVSEDAFKKMCADAVEARKNDEVDTVREKYEQKLDKLEAKHKKEQMEFEDDKQELGHRRLEEVGKGIENAIGLFSGRRRSISTSLTKRRMTSKAKSDLAASEQDIKNVEAEMKAMETDMATELKKIGERWDAAVDQVTEIPIAPYKKNIFMEVFGLIWLPYYAFESEGGWMTVPAFEWKEK